MQTPRRSFLSVMAAMLAGAQTLLAQQQNGSPFPPIEGHPPGPAGQPGGLPDASRSGRLGDVPTPSNESNEERLQENERNLRSDVDHLLQLAQQLKDEADKTEQTKILSLSIIRRAEEIEKLAHQIRGLARGD